MSFLYRMPSLGADMEAGTLLQWLTHAGDRVSRGDVVAVVETQKGAIDVEIFHDGVISRLLVEPGTKVPVGTPLAELEGEGETNEALEVPAAPASTVAPTAVDATAPTAPAPAATRMRARASPAARQLAQKLGLSVATLRGRGPDGAVLLADVEAAAGTSRATTSKPATRGPDLAAMRQAIAAAMSRSKREIPHYYLSQEIELVTAADWLSKQNAERPPEQRLLLGALLLKAVAVSLRRFPEFNGFDRGGRFEPGSGIHVGSATAIRGGGLVAPAIHDTDQLDLDTLMARLRDLVARVRAASLRSSELADPTITVSSLGERGVERLYGVIYPPQVAIVGFGTPATRPRVVGDSVQARLVVNATLAADHRHSDGHRGALFLAHIERLLQEPEKL